MHGKILIRDKTVLATKYIKHVFRHVKFNNKKSEPFEMNTNVIILPLGGLILPYFKDSEGKWKIVLVRQYRPAVKKQTIEAPGGKLDSEPAKTALSRELKEETGIKVGPKTIKIVIREYSNTSIININIIGGIVRINQCMVKDKKNAGNKSENEWTQVKIFDLIEILKKRDNGSIMLDLLTSRLIDEVAKEIGLLIKNY